MLTGSYFNGFGDDQIIVISIFDDQADVSWALTVLSYLGRLLFGLAG